VTQVISFVKEIDVRRLAAWLRPHVEALARRSTGSASLVANRTRPVGCAKPPALEVQRKQIGSLEPSQVPMTAPPTCWRSR
jgi:hypothetical protein